MKKLLDDVQQAGKVVVKKTIKRTVKRTKYVAAGVKQDFNMSVEVIQEDVGTLGKTAVDAVDKRVRTARRTIKRITKPLTKPLRKA